VFQIVRGISDPHEATGENPLHGRRYETQKFGLDLRRGTRPHVVVISIQNHVKKVLAWVFHRNGLFRIRSNRGSRVEAHRVPSDTEEGLSYLPLVTPLRPRNVVTRHASAPQHPTAHIQSRQSGLQTGVVWHSAHLCNGQRRSEMLFSLSNHAFKYNS
jgi:hypothetical protein